MARNNGNGDSNGNGQATRLRESSRCWRNLHIWTGLIAGLWFIFMAITGVLVNHQVSLGLDEIQVSNRHLPAAYTDEFHPESTQLNVVLTDLHSGRFFGEHGRLIGDFVALLVIISVVSGFYAHRLRRRANDLGVRLNGAVAGEPQLRQVESRPLEEQPAAVGQRGPSEPS